jgi:hypothetical protein
MYLMYVDESGDPGLAGSPTQYFVLSGLVVHELRWRPYLERLVEFRRRLKTQFGLKLREEIHAAALITRPGDLVRIRRNDRLTILRAYAKELATLPDLNIINIVVDKRGKQAPYDVFDIAWRALIQRFENTLSYRNFRGPANPDERGIILCDHTDNKKLTSLLRTMRHYNPVPNTKVQFGQGYRNLMLAGVIEDPIFRDSKHSYFIQSVDTAAYLLHQLHAPDGYFRRMGARNYFKFLDPILCKVAARADPLGIVRL